jgi:hypothetical protein
MKNWSCKRRIERPNPAASSIVLLYPLHLYSNQKNMSSKPRIVFIVSDGTGITAETFSQSILAQFELPFRQVRMPFINTVDKAHQAVREINEYAKTSGLEPIVFTTLVDTEVNAIVCLLSKLLALSQPMQLVDSITTLILSPIKTELKPLTFLWRMTTVNPI